MNHADFGLGTWQPTNGFYDVVNAMVDLGKSLGVKYYTNHDVSSLNINEGKVESITINNKIFDSDIVLSGADYAHTESLLDPKYRQYSNKYWSKKHGLHPLYYFT